MDESVTLRQKLSDGLVVLLALTPLLASAVTTVTVKVTVVAPPPCVINGDKVIDVDFGSNVVTSKVDGVNYLKTVDYTLECQGNTTNAMKLQVKGSAASFDSSALQTNVANFGVALRANGQPLVINKWLNFTYPEKPVLQAVPVKKAGVTLSSGGFSAGATLMADYQ